jgi:protein gp37
MSDLFHDDVPEKFIAKVFAIMDLARQHTYMVLTKRPERAAKLLSDEDFQFHVGWFQSQAIREFGLPEPEEIGPFPFKNVWIGVSVENQATADERIPLLLQAPAKVRFISAEPLLGPVDLSPWLGISRYEEGAAWARDTGSDLDWVIAGGESGPNARPMHPDWVRSLRDQCQTAGTKFFFKQWGEWTSQFPQGLSLAHRAEAYRHGQSFYRVGKKIAGRELDGRTWDELPEVQP